MVRFLRILSAFEAAMAWNRRTPNKQFFSYYYPKPFQWYFSRFIDGWRLNFGSVRCSFWIRSAGSRTIKYSCKLTLVLIQEVISQIRHTQHLCLRGLLCTGTDWVWQFIIRIGIKTNKLRVHKISFKMQNRTNPRTGFRCFSLTFVSI